MAVIRLSKPCVRCCKYLVMLLVVFLLLGFGFVNKTADTWILSSLEFDNAQAFKEAVDDMTNKDPLDRIEQLNKDIQAAKEGIENDRRHKAYNDRQIKNSKYIHTGTDETMDNIETLNKQIRDTKERMKKLVDEQGLKNIELLNKEIQAAKEHLKERNRN